MSDRIRKLMSLEQALESQARQFANMAELAVANGRPAHDAIGEFEASVYRLSGEHPSLWQVTDSLSQPKTGFARYNARREMERLQRTLRSQLSEPQTRVPQADR